MFFIYLAFCSVIPWGLEPQSKEPESFILSIELRNQMRCKDNKKNGIAAGGALRCAGPRFGSGRTRE